MNNSVYGFGVGLSALGVAFGGSAFGTALAAAEPNDVVWNVEAYDDCMNTIGDANRCCVESGGVPITEPLDGDRGQKCQAPFADAQASDLVPTAIPRVL